ncbi:hypothetical protein [Sphingomonas sp. AX6]|uniref:hypothetical protein n=1 Tax=Sphingomonas sp. AX6 TaxID=2653171 RepID=UPI001F48B352|nr:hypothetical protein [Sphingomonas sp. AX6]
MSIAALLALTILSPDPADAVAECSRALAERPARPEDGITVTPRRDLVCFDGRIDQRFATAFIAASKAQGDAPATFVVRSVGGEVHSAMSMGEEILRRRGNVIAHRYCLSSCANYLLPAGRTRTVWEGAVLGFHGGAVALSDAEILAAIKASGEASDAVPKAQIKSLVAQIRNDTKATIARQGDYLEGVGVRRDFFEWMARFDGMPRTALDNLCEGSAGPPAFVVLSPELLARFGYRIDEDRGPADDAQTDAALIMAGLPPGLACHVDVEEAPT